LFDLTKVIEMVPGTYRYSERLRAEDIRYARKIDHRNGAIFAPQTIAPRSIPPNKSIQKWMNI
jgi:hypothetical protein